MNWEKRTYQQEAIANCIASFTHRNKSSVMLESPVGSGKTYMALEIIHALQERLGKKLKVNWVAPRLHLLQQVMEANRLLHQDLIRPISLFEKVPPKADLVVLDEAHHEATQSCINLYEKMQGDYTLGLSATPLRTDRMKLSFLETITTCSIDRLIREGFLTPFHSYLLPHYDPQIISECFLHAPEKWGKSIAFFHTIAECRHFQTLINNAGFTCEVVTSESDKDRQLQAFLTGKINIIANVSMLTEGFDQPDVQTIFVRDATRLPTIQMCGRGLRLSANKPHCNIVQSVKTKFFFERLSPAKERFRLMNHEWRALQDRTQSIEETLKTSLALLERREANHRKRPHAKREQNTTSSSTTNDTPFTHSTKSTLSLYHQHFWEHYKMLYQIYNICNRICWSGKLPLVALCLNRKKTDTRVCGFAIPNATQIQGVSFHQITLVLKNPLTHFPNMFPFTLMHEMTHIWQFANGRKGGHGGDFKKELQRIGISESPMLIIAQKNSLAERAILTINAIYPTLIDNLKAVYQSPLSQRPKDDLAFFTYLLSHPNPTY